VWLIHLIGHLYGGDTERSRKGYENVCLSVRGRRECGLLMHLTNVALENRFGSLGGLLVPHCILVS